MGWFSRSVIVTFIDDATGAVFATTTMPPDNLPESFELQTTLQLGDADWSVVHAEPRTRAEYKKTGTLTLRLRKIELMSPGKISFSQLDITEEFGDDQRLSKDDWIATTPLNARIPDPQTSGLPSPDVDPEEVYRIATEMSALRESIPVPNDGVYCPICHIANVDLQKLKTPCPQCGRALLKFGWD